MRSPYRRYVGSVVCVQVGEDTIKGTLMEAGETLRLRDAVLWAKGPQDMDGTVAIPAVAVRWVQVP